MIKIVKKGEIEMETLIVSGGDINMEQLKRYCEKHVRSKYNSRR